MTSEIQRPPPAEIVLGLPGAAAPLVRSEDHLKINEVAFEQGMRSLDHQRATLESIRTRAVAIATVSGAVAAFLGHEVLTRLPAMNQGLSIHQHASVWLALSSLGLSVICVIQMIRPRAGWVFHFTSSKIIDQFAYGKHATDLSRTYEVLARFAETHHDNNEAKLRATFCWLRIALAALVGQVVAWLITMN